ncbi:amino acid adenylation domain-containing protein [Micromonospora sp. DSM 115977]|uniref:Amino acid adenylation domain-containing protein n=1 Tax=Micromonospora reichwaldensis TaxID=3075516 RepID=A0ABU2WPY3_9ACTN|nr:non-ribosomal peptide synthetase [Micromonospora sp. DSM 115977]MDT0527968.1 amino acid adenylation domain-containing protein [Micromonospora sp. DSM 115977]
MSDHEGGHAVSSAQEQLWFVDQLRSGASEYLLHQAVRVRGPLDATALRAALSGISARHEILRTRYDTVDGRAVQVIDPPGPVDVDLVDLGDSPAGDRDGRLDEVLDATLDAPFDLRGDAPLRARLIRCATDDHVLLLVVHHIAFDGWSWGVLARELHTLYGAFVAGRPDPLPPLPVQYADFAAWQRENWLSGPHVDAQVGYWRERLSGLGPLDLPTDRPRPAHWQAAGDGLTFTVPADLATALTRLGADRGATPFMVFLAAFQLLLGRYAGQTDVAVGVSVAGRHEVELEDLIGLFVNTVVLRADLAAPACFLDLLDQVRGTTLDAYDNQQVPFDRIVAELSPERDLSRNPLFQVGFGLHNADRAAFALPGLTVAEQPTSWTSAAFDLSLQLVGRPDGSYHGEVVFPTALFDGPRVHRMVANYLHLLAAVVAAGQVPLDELDLLAPRERREVLGEWGRGADRPAGPGLPELFLAQAAATPDATALIADDGTEVGYAELAGRARKLAAHLHTVGVRVGSPVGVAVHRGPDLVTALLGVLLAGGVYVPLAPDQPVDRLEFMAADAGVSALVTESALRGLLSANDAPVVLVDTAHGADDSRTDAEGGTATVSLPATDPDAAAYVMYTSGSTGRPKGVVVTHAGIRNRVLWSVEQYRLTAADRVLQKTALGFDASMWEFLAPLVSGGAVVLAAPDAHRDPGAMLRAMRAHDVTVLQLVPSVLRVLLHEADLSGCAALRLVCSAGEPLPAALCEQLRALLPVEVWNTYGPTECAIDATAWRYRGDEGTGTVPIGRPLPGCGVLVLDADDRPVPVGVAGQLCLGGIGLARGYLGRPGLTGEKFTPNPYGGPGERLYRTGDVARWRDDGSLEYLGRLDHQVKLHGVRIEPGEVEAALRRHPTVDAAVVALHRPPSGDAELVAYVVPAAGARIDPDGLRDALADRLPAALVPSTVISLESLPLTANGKLDRAALPAPDGPRPDAGRRYLPPATDTERAVAGIWAELLGVERIGRDDNFFTLGGHSLLAIRGVLRVRRALDVELTVGQLFTAPTVGQLAALVDEARHGAGSTDEPADAAIRPVTRDGKLPLSLGQRRLWFLDQLEPGSLEYLIPISMRLTGPLDVAVFRRALDEVVNRHEILRTRYHSVDGEPVQVVDPPGPVGWELIDLSGAPDVVDGAEVLLRVAAGRPFDLATERPIRAQVIRVAADEHLVALTMHHIAFDVWSMDILLRELDTLYRRYARGGAATALPDLPVQYADFAAWETARQDSPELDAQLAYWSRQLAGSTPLELPIDRPRPALRDPAGDNVVVDVPTDVGRALAELGNREGATLFMVLLAAFQVLLGRYARQHDVAVGTPVAGRTRQETEDLLGFFVNNLVMRAELVDDQPFPVLLDQVRRTVTDAFRNQDVAFERLVDALRPDRDLSRNPLFQVMFELQHLERMTATLGPTTIAHVDSTVPVAKFDLTLSVEQHPDGRLRCWFEYATALWDRPSIERMAGHYLHLLAQVATAPGTALRDLTLPTGAERAYLLGPLAGEPVAPAGPLRAAEPAGPLRAAEPAGPLRAAEAAGAGVVELFGRRVRQHPDVVAVEFDGRRLTFAELDTRANRLAHHLRELGVRPEVPVAVCLERGLEVVVTLLAVLKAGGVYLPVDPDHPTERLRFMIADARAAVVVTEASFADRVAADGVAVVAVDADRAVIAGRDGTAPDPSTGSDDLAYVIYTSGSTGRPKGAMIPHGAYAHHCEVIARAYDIAPGDRVVLLSALTFDVAMDGMMATLLAGATLVVSDPVFWSPAELPDRLARHRITHMEITPAYYREVMDALPAGDDRLRHLKLMNVGSDVVTVADARRWAATGLPGRFLVNYGPTEATVTCLLHPVTGDPSGERNETLPIGRPVPGTRTYVVDEHLDPVPVGVPGELLLGGVRLARGYLGRPALTADRFVPDPFGDDPGGRLYRSGDLVRYRPDGTIEFLGRIDQQVKIRGFRMELGEIESALAEHPAVRAVAVVARETQPGEKGLVAYLVCRDGTPPAVGELRAHLRDRLPDYMVPAQWMVLDALPLTTSKKVDRRALPAPTPVRADPGRAYEAPRTPLEEAVADIWATVLEVDRVGVHDDFFDLGGHSLLATRVLAHLRQGFDLDLPLRLLFEQTTVADLADAVQTAIENEISQLSDAEVAELLKEGNL